MTSTLLPLLAAVVLSVPIAGVIAVAAYKMQRLELYGLAVIASLLAMLPCHPGFIIGLPIGLWSIVVLAQPDVKAAFRQGGSGKGGRDNSIRHEKHLRDNANMTKSQLIPFSVAIALSGAAALLFVAGAPRFDLVPRTYANIGGIALAVVSGLFWTLFGVSFARKS